MKICRIISAYPPFSFGGADICAAKIDEALQRHNIKQVVISIHPQKKETIESNENKTVYCFYPYNVASIHTIGKSSIVKQAIWTALDFYSLYSYKKIKNILQKEKPDVVHLHTPIDVTLSSIDAVKSLRLPLIYTLHDYFLLCRRFVLMHGFKTLCTDNNINPLCHAYRAFSKRMTDNKIDVVIAPSQFVLDLHKKYGFFKNTKTVVLPHGIDLNTADAQKYCENIAKKDSNFHILYVGGLLRQKGVHVLINAFMQIKDANLKLHVVGGGANEDALRRLAQKDERITFHGRHPAHEVQKFYPLADITVVPSLWYDVRPGVIVESFKFGVPVIASNIGGIPELVKNGHNGYLCEPGNEKQLASILKQCIQDAQYIKKLGANAKEFVKQFEMSLYTKKLLTIYSEAIALNKSRY